MSDELILRPDLALIVPRGKGGDPLVFNMKTVLKAETRLIEIQAVTREKAGELLAVYNEAWRECRNYVCMLTRHLNDVSRCLDEEKARIILDDCPRILKERGLGGVKSSGGNEDQRNAVIALDPKYKQLSERKDQIEGAIEWLDIKSKAFEKGYYSVQKLTDPKDRRPDNRVSGLGESDIGVGASETFEPINKL